MTETGFSLIATLRRWSSGDHRHVLRAVLKWARPLPCLLETRSWRMPMKRSWSSAVGLMTKAPRCRAHWSSLEPSENMKRTTTSSCSSLCSKVPAALSWGISHAQLLTSVNQRRWLLRDPRTGASVTVTQRTGDSMEGFKRPHARAHTHAHKCFGDRLKRFTWTLKNSLPLCST